MAHPTVDHRWPSPLRGTQTQTSARRGSSNASICCTTRSLRMVATSWVRTESGVSVFSEVVVGLRAGASKQR